MLDSDALWVSSLLEPSPLSSLKSSGRRPSNSLSPQSSAASDGGKDAALFLGGSWSGSVTEWEGYTACSSVFRLSTMTALWPGTSRLSCSVTVLGGFVPDFLPLQSHLHPFCAFVCMGAAGVGLELHCWPHHLLKEKEQGNTRDVCEVTFSIFLRKGF